MISELLKTEIKTLFLLVEKDEINNERLKSQMFLIPTLNQ